MAGAVAAARLADPKHSGLFFFFFHTPFQLERIWNWGEGSSFCGALFQARLSVPPAVSLRGGMQACGHLRRMLWCYLEQVIADAVQRDLSLVPA